MYSTKESIVEFLREKPGYLKEGRTRLAKTLGLDHTNQEVTDMCIDALRQVREELKEDYPQHQGLKLKSRWQGPDGKWLESYKVDESAESMIELKDALVEDLSNLRTVEAKEYVPSDDPDPYLMEINLPDFHFGKQDGRTLEQQEQEFFHAVTELVYKGSGYTIERFVIPVGNDLFNSDTEGNTTTAGTPQQDNANWQDTFRAGTRSVIRSINFLSNIAPVDIVIVQGNHDWMKAFFLGDILDAYYRNDNNITVKNETNAPRKYYSYGVTMLGYTHGKYEKQADLPLLMAVEQPQMFASAMHHYIRIGHFHKEQVNTYQGVVVEFMPALCGQDYWHKKMGYTGHRRAIAYLYSKQRGQEGRVQINK